MNLLRQAALAFTLTLATAGAMPAHAGLTCENVFAGKLQEVAAPRSKIAAMTADLRNMIAMAKAPAFSLERYDSAMAEYTGSATADWKKPKTREARLALINMIGMNSGFDPLAIESFVRDPSVSKDELRVLTRDIGRINPAKGISGVQIESIFMKVYNFSHTNPATLRNARKIGLTELDKQATFQWVQKEIGTHSFVEAVDRLGLLRAPNARERLVTKLKHYPSVVQMARLQALGVLEILMAGLPISAPKFSLLESKRLSPEHRKLVLDVGLEAAYPVLKQAYGSRAKFDRNFSLAGRAYSRAMTAFLLVVMYPVAMQAALPPSYETTGHGALQLTKDVLTYHSGLAKRIIEREMSRLRGEKPDPTLIPTQTLQIDDDSMVTTDSEPVPVARTETGKKLDTKAEVMESLEETIDITAPDSGETSQELEDLNNAVDQYEEVPN